MVVGEVGEEEAPKSRCSKLLQACKRRMTMDAWAVGATKQTHCSRMVEEVAVVEAVVEERTVRPTVVVSGWATYHGHHSLRFQRSMEMSVAVVM